MRYSIESRDRMYVKGYGFLSFSKKNWYTSTKVAKSMNNKYSQKLLDSAKKSATDATKAALKRAIQKTTEATGDLIVNKIADKITSISKSSKEFHSQNASKEQDQKIKQNEIEIPKERYIYPGKKTRNY